MGPDGEISTSLKSSDVTVEDLVDYSIQASNAQKTDHITITGRKSLGLLFGVCRRGFLHAKCRVGNGPHAAEDPADSLWILSTENAAELRTIIADCGRDLRINGTLIVALDPNISADGASRVKEVLTVCGYVPENESHPTDKVFLLCARKQERRVAIAA
jgi:hypothetical protein